MSETTQIILAVVGTSATALGVLVGILAFLYRIQGRQIGNVQISLSNLVRLCLMGLVATLPAATAQESPACEWWDEEKPWRTITVEAVTSCLGAGADVNARFEFGTTPLHRAASDSTNPAIIAVLLKAGADVNARDNMYKTPLHDACRGTGDLAMVEALVNAGAEVNAREKFGWTPLHLVGHHAWAAVEVLVRAGADIDAIDREGDTRLYNAVERLESPALIEALLDGGANVMARNMYFGHTPWGRLQELMETPYRWGSDERNWTIKMWESGVYQKMQRLARIKK